jgi:hypothetical protein
VTLKVIEQAKDFGLDMVVLLLHTSNAFEPLDVSYFKRFKTKHSKNNETMVINNYLELNNMILVNYVDITLEHVLLKIKHKVNV